MKVVLITYNTPSSENIRAASALPYHLLIKREQDVEVLIYSFNANKLPEEKISNVERSLHLYITLLPMPQWLKWLFKYHLLFLRVFLKYPFSNYIRLTDNQIEAIKEKRPDLIWIYGEELSQIAKQFPNHKRIHLGPDTESLYYYRMMGRRFVMNNVFEYWKCAMMYRKYARMERKFPTDENYTYLAVGEEDIKHLQQLNPNVRAKFLKHPHYNVNDNLAHNRKFHQPKIRILIAGQYNLYMKQSADELFSCLRYCDNNSSSFLRGHYTVTFLGRGWEMHVEVLKNGGWEVEQITYASDYLEEIMKHDIQITPITIGTGTKGKVLDALANGLLVIGTQYALENIAVEHGDSCIEYSSPQEVIDLLLDIPANREKYESIAHTGRNAVLKYHNRDHLSKELFSI